MGPPSPPTLRALTVPGPLLQGDSIDLALDFSGIVSSDDGSTVEARAEGVGLSTNTVIASGTSRPDDDPGPDVVVHVLASVKAELGPHQVRVAYTPLGGVKVEREATVEVRAPIEVRPGAASLFIGPGEQANLPVEVVREKGFDGEVDLKLEGLPRGVKALRVPTMGSGIAKAEIRLEMGADARPLEAPKAVRVVGVARMPRGNVAVVSKQGPMIGPRAADK